MKYPIITIAREYGSGGRIIAKKLAEELGIGFYDKELITLAAKESGLSEDFIQKAQQRPTTSFLYNLYFNSQSLPISDQVFIAQSQVIQDVAEKGPCVIVGRCGDYVLRERNDCLHVFIHAPLADRISRVSREYQVEAKDYRDLIVRRDKGRSAYYQHFTDQKWGKCQNFHLSLDSSLGIDLCVALIRQAAIAGEGGI